MASKFYNDISEDERKEWRQHPTTVLAIEMLNDSLADSASTVLNGSPARKPEHTAYELGFHQAIKGCIELLTRES